MVKKEVGLGVRPIVNAINTPQEGATQVYRSMIEKPFFSARKVLSS